MSTLQHQVKTILDTACDDGGVPGAVFAAMDRSGSYIIRQASGVRNKGQDAQPMTVDTTFSIFSCRKIFAAIACMQLVEEGKCKLDDPAEAILTELKQAKMLDGSSVRTKITLRMLLTHTSGYAYPFFSAALKGWIEANTPFVPVTGRTGFLQHPLTHEPGQAWHYGTGIDWADCYVSRLTGEPFEVYCKRRIFEPLGCKDIQFNWGDESVPENSSAMHARLKDGNVINADANPEKVNGTLPRGGYGCTSNVEDYLKCILILINRGKGANGAQILRPESVEEMWRDQLAGTPPGDQLARDEPFPTAESHVSNDFHPFPGVEKSWSLAGSLTKEGLTTGRSANSVWWAGLANLYWAADREKGIVNMFASQCLPFWDMHSVEPWLAAEKAVYDSLLPAN